MTNADGQRGSYVTDDRIGKVDDALRSDETIRYMARGNDVKAKYRGSTTSFDNTKGWPRMVVTDQRVFIKVPKVLSTKVESIAYGELTAADVGSSGMTGVEIKLRTTRGKTYVFRADEPDNVELEELVEFVRTRIASTEAGSAESGEPTTASSRSSTATTASSGGDLHKTESCVECGESVSEGVARCSHCGYNPGEHKKWFYVHAVLAGVAGATVIGLLIVPIFAWKGYKHRTKYRGGVTG